MTPHVGTTLSLIQTNKQLLAEEIHVPLPGKHALVPRGTDNALQLRINSLSRANGVGVELRVEHRHAHRQLLPLLVLRVHRIDEIAVAAAHTPSQRLQLGVGRRTDEEDRVRTRDVHALEVLEAAAEQQHANGSVLEVASVAHIAGFVQVPAPNRIASSLLVDDAALALVAALHQEALDVHVLEVAVAVQQNALVRAVVQHLDHVRVNVLHARVARLRDRVAGQAEEELSRWGLHVNPTIQQYDDVCNGARVNGAHLQTTLKCERGGGEEQWG